MMRSVASTTSLLIVTCVLALPANSHEGQGHGHATGIVKERMDLMEGIGKRMKSINSHIKEKRQLNTSRTTPAP